MVVTLDWLKASDAMFGSMFFFITRVTKALGVFGATIDPRNLVPRTTKREIHLSRNRAYRPVPSGRESGWVMITTSWWLLLS